METIYLCIVIFLFVLAVFDLVVGVSNDAVNFLQSAVGAKAASFKTILFIAGIGVFIGAALSNGMMDIACTHTITSLLYCQKLNEFTSCPITRFHPSARINSRILNGMEIVVGGSIIIPIDISTEDTTISITINGT